jgi:hypothetical protein
MAETMNQVSSNLEFNWIFKNSFQNSKSLLYRLTDIDMFACHVLKILFSNMSWSFHKSWSIHCGEEHTKSWLEFDPILIIKFELPCCHQGVDTAILEADYLLIHSSNGCAPLIQFVECYVGSSFAFGPFADLAQIQPNFVPTLPTPLHTTCSIKWVHGHHVGQQRPTSMLHAYASLRLPLMFWRSLGDTPPLPLTPHSLSIAPCSPWRCRPP